MLAIHLRDTNPAMAAAWQDAFASDPDVEVSAGDILELNADAIVSPANSFGYMDGGIDLAYSKRFGFQLEARLQATLLEHHHGELPVGQAAIVPTGDPDISFLVSAPTMRVPASVARSLNAYLAFRASLIAVLRHNGLAEQPISSMLVPGLCTGVGEMPPNRAARQMKAAYESIIRGRGSRSRNLGQIWGEHQDLLL